MPVGARAMRLQARDNSDGEVALARQRTDGGRDGAGGDAGDLPEQAAPIEAVRAQPLGDREHHLPVRHRREEGRVQPLRPDRQPLGVAAWAEVPALAGERQQVLVRAGVAADAGEAVLEHAAGEAPGARGSWRGRVAPPLTGPYLRPAAATLSADC